MRVGILNACGNAAPVSLNGAGGGASGGCAGPARARAWAVHGTEHRRTQCHFDLDDGFHAAHPAQDDPAAAAGGHVSRSPAGHVLAAHRLPGRGERGQVRGGLGAVAPADRTDQPEHCGQHRDQGGDGDRRPHGGRATVNGIGRGSTSVDAPGTGRRQVRHRSSTWLRRSTRRRPASAPPPSTAPGSSTATARPTTWTGSSRTGAAVTSAGRLVAAHRQLDAGTRRVPAVPRRPARGPARHGRRAGPARGPRRCSGPTPRRRRSRRAPAR